jgi:Protein of unknown function (DUF3431).
MNTSTFDLVVSRYSEDIGWLSLVPKEYHVFLYDKGYGTNGIKLPNVGRESHTYIHHIVKHYGALPDYTVFAQGDPFHHVPSFMMVLERVLYEKPDWEAWGLELECDRWGGPHHIEKLPCQEIYSEIIGKELPDKLRFNCGAQFCVSRKNIQRIKRPTWERALKLSEDMKLLPWAIERLWPYLLEPKKKGLLCCLNLW